MGRSAARPSYLDHARDGRGDRAAYRRGSLIAGLVWAASSLALVKLVIWGTIEVARSSDPQGLLEAVAASDHAPWPWLGFLAALIGFIPIAVVLPAVIQHVNQRSWRTSLTPYLTVDGRRILLGAAVFGGLYLLVAAGTFGLLRDSVTIGFDLGQFVPGLVVLVALVWVQAFGQELFFRGYQLQWAWLDTQVPAVAATISGLAFGVPFLFAPWVVEWVVPEIQVPDVPLLERAVLMLGYVLVGAAFALASIRTGTVELAIGAAFSFNLLTAIVLAPTAGQLAGGSLVEVEAGLLPTTAYVALLAVALFGFARLSRRLAPDPAGRPLLRDAADRDVLGLPAGNPIWRVSVRTLLTHKLRLALTLVTITLSVGFVTATLVFADTTNRALDQFFAQEPADVVVRPADPITEFGRGGRPAALTMPDAVADSVATVPGVAAVSPSVNQDGVLLLDGAGGPLGGTSAPHVGASWIPSQLPGGTAELVAELPRGDGQVAIDATTADRNGISPGDPIRLVTPLRPDAAKEWTVTGIVDLGLPGGATIAIFDLRTAQALITGAGQVNQLLVRTSEDPATVAGAIERELGTDSGLEALTGAQAAQQSAAEVQGNVGFLNTLLLVFAVIATITAVTLIVNTFGMLVAQRARELALLRAVGASGSQLQSGVVVQALLLGVIGTVLGIAVGLYLAIGIRRGLRWFDIDVPGGGLVVAPGTLVVTALIGVGVTLLASWLPALVAGRAAPVQAMTAAHRPTRESAQRRAIGAGLLAALAGATAVLSLRDSLAQNAVAWMGVSALLGLVCLVVAAPWLVRPLLAVLRPPLRNHPGQLAVANAARNPRRVTTTAAALMLGVALVVMLTVLTTSTSVSASAEIDETFGSDLSIGIPPRYPPYDHELTQRAAEVAGVSGHTFIRTTSGQRFDLPIPVFGVEPGRITEAVRLTATSGSIAAVGGDRIAVDSALAARYGARVGSTFKAEFRTGSREFRVVAVFDPVLVFEGIVTDLATAESLGARSGMDTAAYFFVAADADRATVRSGIAAAVAANPAVQVQDTATLKANVQDSVDELLGFVFAMLALTVVIAVLAIVNTMLLSVHERTAEIGMLRAIGATRGQVRSMVMAEAAIVGAFGAVCGLGLGLLYGVGLRAVMAPLGIGQLALPWWWLVGSVVVGAAAGVLAAIWPAVSAARQPMLAAITTE